MSFDIAKPRDYEKLDQDPSYEKALETFCNDYKLQVLSRQRVCNSKRYNLLLAFDDLNLFVESIIAFREHDVLWQTEVMGKGSPTFHVIDPDYQNYEKKIPQLISLLENTLVALCQVQMIKPKKSIAEIVNKEPNGIERLQGMLEKRLSMTRDSIDNIHSALHMLRSSDENQILN